MYTSITCNRVGSIHSLSIELLSAPSRRPTSVCSTYSAHCAAVDSHLPSALLPGFSFPWSTVLTTPLFSNETLHLINDLDGDDDLA
jgi:hypothetical protein